MLPDTHTHSHTHSHTHADIGGTAIAIRCTNLTKGVGRGSRNLILDLGKGVVELRGSGVYGILGANGSGKSTWMRLMAGVLPPTTGTVALHVNGTATATFAPLVGYLPEETFVVPELTVVEFLGFCARVSCNRPLHLSRGEVRGEVRRVMELCRVEQFATTLCGKLSKGYRKRVSVGAALLFAPPVVILDEPTSDMDAPSRSHLHTLIRGMGQGHTVVVSSHLMEDMAELCQRVFILDDGRLAKVVDLSGNAGNAGSGVDGNRRLLQDAYDSVLHP